MGTSCGFQFTTVANGILSVLSWNPVTECGKVESTLTLQAGSDHCGMTIREPSTK